MKFKIDENLSADCADVLRQAGHDAKTVWDHGLRGKAAPLTAISPIFGRRLLQMYPEIMALSVIRQDKAHVIEVLRRAVALFGSQPIAGHLWIVEDHRMRIWGGSE